MERVISLLVMATGALATGIGVVSARRRLQFARRAHQKTAHLYAAMPDGWTSWFLQGFAGLTIGTRGLFAAAAWMVWTLAGLCFIGLGFSLL
jgi:hypothetical protein